MGITSSEVRSPQMKKRYALATLVLILTAYAAFVGVQYRNPRVVAQDKAVPTATPKKITEKWNPERFGPPSAQRHMATYIVTTASAAAGTYTEVGTFNSRPYCQRGSDSFFLLAINTGMEILWVISDHVDNDDSGHVYASVPDSSMTPYIGLYAGTNGHEDAVVALDAGGAPRPSMIRRMWEQQSRQGR